MHRRLAAVFVVGFVGLLSASAVADPSAESSTVATTRSDDGGLSRLPLAFETNRGQAPDGWDFLVRCRGYHAFVKAAGVTFSFDGAGLAMTLDGARRVAPTTDGLALPGRVNYLKGDDPSRWVTDIPLVRGAVYADVAPGTGWSVGGDGRELEFAFDLAPSAASPRLLLDGSRDVAVAADGSLRVAMPTGRATFSRPVAWQEIDGRRVAAEAKFVVEADGAVRVAVRAKHADRAVRVDPTVSYESYLAGAKADLCNGVAMNSSNFAHYVGSTLSADFPKTLGAYKTAIGGTGTTTDAFVSKVNPDGATLAYSTYLGGNQNDGAYAVVVNASDEACVVGLAGVGFPTTAGANTSGVSFLVRLSSTGSSALLATYTNNSRSVLPGTMAAAPSGDVYFLETNGVSRYSTTTYNPIWFKRITPTSGSGTLTLSAVASDASGNVFVVGYTNMSTFATTTGVFQTSLAGGTDAFLTKIDSSGTTLFSTLLGGSSTDQALGVDVNQAGQAYVVGTTLSTNFPLSPDARSTAPGTAGQFDAFITRFGPTGGLPRYSSYLGNGEARAVRVHSGATCVIAGRSTAFPIVNGFQSSPGGGYDGIVLKMERDGSIAWSSYVGGTQDDVVNALAMAADGSVAIGGSTSSTDIPLVNALFGSSTLGDAFMAGVPDTLTPVAPVGVGTATLPDWTTGFVYSVPELAPTGGVGPYLWQLVAGTFPPGLFLNQTGAITGTPSQAGSYAFTLRVVDAAETFAERVYVVRINLPPSVSTPNLPDATVDTPYDKTVGIADGSGAKTFSLLSGTPPPGLTLGVDGHLSGTPTQTGSRTITVFVVDGFGATCSGAVTTRVNPLPTITNGALPEWTQGRPYLVQFATIGGTPGFVWSKAVGKLPTATPIDSLTGRVSGTASAAGHYAFTINATDANGAVASKAFTVDLNLPPSIAGDPLPLAAVGRPYSARFPRIDGTAPFVWTRGNGDAVPGLTLDVAEGVLSGVPTTPQSGITTTGSYVCVDAAGAAAYVDLHLPIAAPIDLAKKKFTEKIAVAVGGDLTTRRFLELRAGTLLSVTLVGGANGRGPSLALTDAAGVPLTLAAYLKSTAKTAVVTKLPIAATGRYFLVATAAPGFSGKASLTVTIAPKTSWAGGAAVAPATDAEFEFATQPGAKGLTITAKAGKLSAALPHIKSILAPDGMDLLPGGKLTEKGKSATFSTKALLAGGVYKVVFAARDANAGALTWTVKFGAVKADSFSMPDVAAGN